MLALFAAVLVSQFQPYETPQPSVEKYAEMCSEAFKVTSEAQIKEFERMIGTKKDVLTASPANKRLAKEHRAKVEELKKAIKDKTGSQDLRLYVESLQSGGIGVMFSILTGRQTIAHNDGRLSSIATSESVYAKVTVRQVISDHLLLCESEKSTFAVRAANTAKDGDNLDMTGVFVVSGRYSYNSVGGAKKTIAVIEKWEHSDKWLKMQEEAKAALEKKTKKPVKK